MEITDATCSLRNQLLESLPSLVRQRLVAALQPCFLPLGKVLCESGASVHHVYFPTDAVVSLSYVTVEGSPAEVSLVGKEGVVGIARFLGGGIAHTSDIVQIAGGAYRIASEAVMAEFSHRTEFMVMILRYVQALMTQIGQNAVCNRHHALDQQFCRVLLQLQDRRDLGSLILTHELIANMLGVRREGVTEAAGRLRRLGVIDYSRGQIRVLCRKQLEELSCECYHVVKREADRLLYPDCGYVPRPKLPEQKYSRDQP